MAQFNNGRQDIVEDAINGLTAASGGTLARLDGYPFIRVVLRAGWDRSKVAIVSGGGSGHEPAHAGFVGQGMLTAAVCGDVFASPSVDAVLAGIRAVTGSAGCLLVVKNYTGDRLNFGLAAARAREEGLDVAMVVVADDIAIPNAASPRGVAGTLLVHKIAGAVAEAGGDLSAVTAAAERAAQQVVSIGMALGSCAVPGAPRDQRIAEGHVELGLGIHGEPGAEQIPFRDARTAVAALAERMLPRVGPGPHVALVNGLGGVTGLELSILLDALIRSDLAGRISHVIGPASMMTALDMQGFSISLYPLSDLDEGLLLASTTAPAWPAMRRLERPEVLTLPDDGARPVPAASWDARRAQLIATCCRALIGSEQDLNALDARTGDGDTGSTVATAARVLLDRIEHLPLADPADLLSTISRQLSQTVGGSSGILLAIFFSAAAEACAEGRSLVEALRHGLRHMQDIGGAKPGDRTMVDALGPALDGLEIGIGAAAARARSGADATSRMSKAGAGRSAHVPADRLDGHTDPGAEAVARVFEALADLDPATS